MLGTNDSKPSNWMPGSTTRAPQYVSDLTAMVDHFAKLSTHPLVYLALPPRAFANTYAIDGTVIHDQIIPLIQQVAAAKGLPVIDVDTPTASQSKLFPDGVHPNDTGYALVAQVMHDGLLRSLAGQGGTSGQGGEAGQGGRGGASGRAGTAGNGPGAAGNGGGTGSGGGASGNDGGGGRSSTGGVSGTGGSPSTGGNPGIGGAAGAISSATGGSTGAGGTPGTATGGAAGPTGSSTSDSGCSCRLVDDGRGDWATIAVLLVGLSFLRSRRRIGARNA